MLAMLAFFRYRSYKIIAYMNVRQHGPLWPGTRILW